MRTPALLLLLSLGCSGEDEDNSKVEGELSDSGAGGEEGADGSGEEGGADGSADGSSDDGGGGSDLDGDGTPDNLDCDDEEASTYPGADESCDGVDNNCDGEVDNDPVDAPTWYPDEDRDGFGPDAEGVAACEGEPGWTDQGGDCDDADPELHPYTPWFRDADGDGFGDPADSELSCTAPEGFVAEASDCNDADPAQHPGATWYADADGDGFGDAASSIEACAPPEGYLGDATDCDDTDAERNPLTPWYPDADADGVGVEEGAVLSCEEVADHALEFGDCDDADPEISPYIEESCDGIDNNCDGTIDEEGAAGSETYYVDADLDGFGGEVELRACSLPAGASERSDDCDDSDSTAYPSAPEICGDGVDQDCNSVVDNSCLVEVDLAASGSSASGGATNDYYGSAAARSDLDGDGVAELIVGAYGQDTGGSSSGAVALTRGSSLPSLSADAWLHGANANAYLGHRVAGLADQDGDGYGEFAASAYGWTFSRGRVYLVEDLSASTDLSGPEVTATLSAAFTSNLGQYVLESAELTGDGRPDLIIGAHTYSSSQGALYVYAAPISSATVGSSSARAWIQGDTASEAVGSAAAAGDWNGDGVGDLAWGSPGAAAGSARLIEGPLSGGYDASDADWEVAGSRSGQGLGSGLVAGDFNGDGQDDLAVASWKESTRALQGGAWMVYEGDGGALDTTPVYSLLCDQSSGWLGSSVHQNSAGDVDLDGDDELFVGWQYDDTEATNAGASYLVYGPMSGTWEIGQADVRFGSTTAGAYAGRLSLLTDLNGDGQQDALIGAQYGDDDRGGLWGALAPGW